MNRYSKLFLENALTSWLIWIFKTIKIYVKQKDVRIEFLAELNQTEIGVNVKIGKYSRISSSEIGQCSYVGSYSTIYNADIGKFTSIAGGVKIGLGTHPANYLSSSPIFYSNDGQLPKSFVKKNKIEQYKKTKIGNDVWIGQNVIILDGVKIGDGAIVGAGSVVTKDIDPFMIVGGVPAKFIKNRFIEEDIERIKESEWWSLNLDKLESSKKCFRNPTISTAVSELNKVK